MRANQQTITWIPFRLPNQSPSAGHELHLLVEAHSGPYELAEAEREVEETEGLSGRTIRAELYAQTDSDHTLRLMLKKKKKRVVGLWLMKSKLANELRNAL